MTHIETAPRSIESLRRHFEIEKELADRLRASTAADRASLYGQVYNELFRRVPDHPQNTRKADAARQEAAAGRQLRLLERFLTPDSTYLEVGAGDCHLAIRIAARVRQSYGIDVSDVIAATQQRPANFALIISDGTSIGVPEASVDVAYSNQLMEHLHPDDASRQLREIFKSLKSGGVYVCVTPQRLSGPHDVSQFFCDEPMGFHMKEYTYGELRKLFKSVGFARTEAWGALKGRHFKAPTALMPASEAGLSLLPAKCRRWLARATPMKTLLGVVTIVGRKG